MEKCSQEYCRWLEEIVLKLFTDEDKMTSKRLKNKLNKIGVKPTNEFIEIIIEKTKEKWISYMKRINS